MFTFFLLGLTLGHPAADAALIGDVGGNVRVVAQLAPVRSHLLGKEMQRPRTSGQRGPDQGALRRFHD